MKECGDSILGDMATQLYLSRPQLNALINCPMSKEDYLKILVDKGVLKMTCPSCQTIVDPTDKVCKQCGKEL